MFSRPEAAPRVLSREDGNVVANASVVQYNEITAENIDSFHFHGDLGAFPLTAILVLPRDARPAREGELLGLEGRVSPAPPTPARQALPVACYRHRQL